jgi:sugar lactone lactonase YvrE
VADAAHHRVVRVADGMVTTVAGTGSPQVVTAWVDAAPGQLATAQPITAPTDVAVSEDGGTLYVASQQDRRIYAVSLGAAVPTITATRSPVPTQTSVITSTVTLTATAVPTSTRTATRQPTCLATATPQSQCIP